jgi:hypothetical protein
MKNEKGGNPQIPPPIVSWSAGLVPADRRLPQAGDVIGDGVRKNGPMMVQIASKLNDREIRAVADYIAGLR